MPQAKKRSTKKRAAKKKTDDSQTDEQTQAEPDQGAEYQPRRRPLENAGLDQVAAEEERQAALAAEREEHNIRTGNASL